ncbi:helix-turn-helix domain-containing protein [Microcoleus sp. T2B6]|uniref:helix-turn-helix domain-containing protein n=1 Tax=Microcoleus sp. T2B6 TaxID=3055424 RepID=UPI002FCF6290
MPKRLKLEPHQTPSELSKLYPQASDPIERTRYQIIWLLATGRVTEDVADVTGYCRNSIYRLVRRYNQLGANGLKDKRHQHPDTQPLLSVVEQAQLLQTLRTPTADGGLWNSRKVAEWMSNLLERPVSVQRGWDYLRSCRRQRRSVIEFFYQAIKAMVNSAVQTPSLIPQVET